MHTCVLKELSQSVLSINAIVSAAMEFHPSQLQSQCRSQFLENASQGIQLGIYNHSKTYRAFQFFIQVFSDIFC